MQDRATVAAHAAVAQPAAGAGSEQVHRSGPALPPTHDWTA
jgi:hypothetical protein